MGNKPVTWFVVNTQFGYKSLMERLSELTNYDIECYKSSGFNLYVRIVGIPRDFVYSNFYSWLELDSLIDVYFIKNRPSSSIHNINEEQFLYELKINEDIYWRVKNDN